MTVSDYMKVMWAIVPSVVMAVGWIYMLKILKVFGRANMFGSQADSITGRELATILAALRSWQMDLQSQENPPAILELFFSSEDDTGLCTPLTVSEIDSLCEKLNFHYPKQDSPDLLK